jgi:hypothetical protein
MYYRMMTSLSAWGAPGGQKLNAASKLSTRKEKQQILMQKLISLCRYAMGHRRSEKERSRKSLPVTRCPVHMIDTPCHIIGAPTLHACAFCLFSYSLFSANLLCHFRMYFSIYLPRNRRHLLCSLVLRFVLIS